MIHWLLCWPHNLLLVAAGYALLVLFWKRLMDIAQPPEYLTHHHCCDNPEDCE